MDTTNHIKNSSIQLSNGVTLYYEETESDGLPVLFVHGIWASCKFFQKQLVGLGKKYRVIALDLRGHGRSSMTLSGQTVPNYAQDLRLFIEHLEIKEFVGVGWSMGAFVVSSGAGSAVLLSAADRASSMKSRTVMRSSPISEASTLPSLVSREAVSSTRINESTPRSKARF